LTEHDPRHLGGHIHPISPYFLAYAALRAGLSQLSFHPDRVKKSGAMLTLLLAPALWLGQRLQRRRLLRKWPAVAVENNALLERIGSWDLLTCRTTVLRAVKPRGEGVSLVSFCVEIAKIRSGRGVARGE